LVSLSLVEEALLSAPLSQSMGAEYPLPYTENRKITANAMILFLFI
jgi:hypothetical protein